MGKNSAYLFLFFTLFLFACEEKKYDLPYYGRHEVVDGDTVYYRVPKFQFINQDSARITHRNVEGKVYVADFFFTYCPTICPAKTRQLTRIQDSLKRYNLFGKEVILISHTVDPDRDTPSVLKTYAEVHSIDTTGWYLVTGEKDYLYRIAKEGYLSTAFADEKAEGGFFHTDQFILLDGERHLRGFYDGTDPGEVDRLWKDIKALTIDDVTK